MPNKSEALKNMQTCEFFSPTSLETNEGKCFITNHTTMKTGKRAREKELQLKRIQTLRDIRDGNLIRLRRNKEENDDDDDSRNIFSEEFWNHIGHEFHLKVNDGLVTIGTDKEARVKADSHAFGIEQESFVQELMHDHQRRVCEDGYTIVSIAETAKENELFSSKREYERKSGFQCECQHLTELIEFLDEKCGLNPTWSLVYDNYWILARRVEKIVQEISGGKENRLNFDALVWRVRNVKNEDEKRGESNNTTMMTAFTPHRDRQPKGRDGTRKSFREDESPKYCTIWIPLTNATCENSCLYVIPRKCDEGYIEGDDDTDLEKTPLEKCLKDKKAYQNITACPVDVGEAVVFSHRTIHWGSKPRDNYQGEPRVNVSFGFSDDSFEKAYLKNRNGVKVTEDADDVQSLPTLKERLVLIASQMIVYHERFPPKNFKALKLLKKIHDAGKSFLDERYREIIETEYIRATSMLAGRRKNESGDDEDEEDDNDDDNEDDELDNALDAMLDAKAKGRGDDFEDDYEDEDDDEFANDPNPDDYSESDPERPYEVTEKDLFFGNATEEETITAKNIHRRSIGKEELPMPKEREVSRVNVREHSSEYLKRPENKEKVDDAKKLLGIKS